MHACVRTLAVNLGILKWPTKELDNIRYMVYAVLSMHFFRPLRTTGGIYANSVYWTT